MADDLAMADDLTMAGDFLKAWDYRRPKYRWLVEGQEPPAESKTEVELYYGQLKIKNEIVNRKTAFEAEMTAERLAFEESQRMKKEAFEKEAVARQDEISNSFLQRIKVCRMAHFSSPMLICSQSEGIEEIRKRTVPAYTFTKFPKLPLELRLYIWNLLCRTDDPSTFILVNMEASCSYWDYSDSGVRQNSTPCIQPTMSKPQRSLIHGKAPIAMRVCKESRAEGKKIYALMLYRAHYEETIEDRKYDNQGRLYFAEQPGDRMCYINILYNQFYMGGSPWDSFQVLVDLIITSNTTRALPPAVEQQLQGLTQIRQLLVDINVFGAAPIELWSKFELETLTIVFYPTSGLNEMKNEDLLDGTHLCYESKNFREPAGGSKMGKRAHWVRQYATRALGDMRQKHRLQWKLPKIKATCRVDGLSLRYVSEEDFSEDQVQAGDIREGRCDNSDGGEHGKSFDHDGDSEYQEEVAIYGSAPLESDDSLWYEKAAAVMVHKDPTRETINTLKRKYHPKHVYGSYATNYLRD